MFSGRFDLFENDPVLCEIGSLTSKNLVESVAKCIPHSLLDNVANTYAVTNVRYKPTQKLVVGMTSIHTSKPIGLRIFPREKLDRRFDAANSQYPNHTFLLPEISAIAWLFPAERKLNFAILEKVSALNELLLAERGCELKCLELAHFVPEHTFTARTVLIDKCNSEIEEYLKIFYDDRGAMTARIMQKISENAASQSFDVPLVTFYSAPHRLLMQSSLQRDFSHKLTFTEAADALAQFHRLSLPRDVSHPSPQASSVEDLLRMVDITAAALLPKTSELLDSLNKVELDVQPAPQVLLHGDPHLGNIFPLTNGRIGFIDLDGVHRGTADADLASFFAFNLWCALRDGKDALSLLDGFDAFIDKYNNKAETPVPSPNAWIALAKKLIFERVLRGISRGKLRDVSELNAFLELAANCLRRATASQRLVVA